MINIDNLTVLPNSWTWTSLGEISNNHDGDRVPVKKGDRSLMDGIYPYYGASGIIDYVNEYLFDGHYLLIGEDGANLLYRSKPIAFKAKGKFWVNNHAHIITLKGNLPLSYVEHYINSIDLKMFVTGTAQPKLTQKSLNNIYIPFPSLNEQHRIIAKIEELFTKLDAGVELLKMAKKQLKQSRQAVLKSAFEGKLTEGWREKKRQNIGDAISYLQKHNSKVTISDTNGLFKIPSEWTWTRIENLAKVSGGITKNSKRERLPNKLPYLRVANVYTGKLDLSEVKTIGVMDNEIPRYLLQKGDLLIIEGNGSPDQIGRVAIWDGSISPCIHQNHIIKVRFYDAEVAAFVQYWLSSLDGRKDIVAASSSTSGLYTLSISKVESLRIPLAPISEQKKIVEEIESHLSVFDSIEKSIDANLVRTETLRHTILAQAFSGKLVPQDPNDESAEKLLERIRAERTQKEGGKERAPGRKRGRQTAIVES